MKIESYEKYGKTYYKFVFYLGYIDGKRKYIKRSGFKTQREARQVLTSLQNEISLKENGDIEKTKS